MKITKQEAKLIIIQCQLRALTNMTPFSDIPEIDKDDAKLLDEARAEQIQTLESNVRFYTKAIDKR